MNYYVHLDRFARMGPYASLDEARADAAKFARQHQSGGAIRADDTVVERFAVDRGHPFESVVFTPEAD